MLRITLRNTFRGNSRVRHRIHLRLIAASAVIALPLASASAATLCVNHGGTGGCWSTISAAVKAAAPGDTIVVAASTYNESVHITKPLSLVGDPFNPPTIDAAGLNNGILIDGSATAPAPGVANVSVYGFKVEHANFEGILVMNGTNITLTGNHVLNNTKALNPGAAECPGCRRLKPTRRRTVAKAFT